MGKTETIQKDLDLKFNKEDDIYRDPKLSSGYWSNLNKEENHELLSKARKNGVRKAIKLLHPELYDVIFSPKREAGLELLNLTGNEVCIDYGCMWGALTIPLAKRCTSVISVDQTLESLEFLKLRISENNLSNVNIVNHNLRTFPTLPIESRADIAIVNGVLEWIPEVGSVELKRVYGKRKRISYDKGYNPKQVQLKFLKKVRENLNSNGKLYLAIENRYDFKMFFGVKDPHSNLHLTTVFPKKVANLLSKMRLGRPYVNWIYSNTELIDLVKEAGFSDVELSVAFPDYRFPEFIQNYNRSIKKFSYKSKVRGLNKKISLKRLTARIIEKILFFFLGLKFLSPSFILIAKK